MTTQYLAKDVLEKTITVGENITIDSLVSTDNYNETKILEKVLKFDKNVQRLLLKCSIHIAVIGYGNRNYGSIRDDNNEVIEIKEIFNKYDILYNRPINDKYDDSSLSARRLVRLYRYQIQEFIRREKRPSYLWFKYSDKDMKKISICFPGAEHLIENREDANYLLSCYKNIDKLLKTNFVQRLNRVFIARGLISPLEVGINYN